MQISPLDVDGWHLSVVFNGFESQYVHDEEDDMYFLLPVSSRGDS